MALPLSNIYLFISCQIAIGSPDLVVKSIAKEYKAFFR